MARKNKPPLKKSVKQQKKEWKKEWKRLKKEKKRLKKLNMEQRHPKQQQKEWKKEWKRLKKEKKRLKKAKQQFKMEQARVQIGLSKKFDEKVDAHRVRKEIEENDAIRHFLNKVVLIHSGTWIPVPEWETISSKNILLIFQVLHKDYKVSFQEEDCDLYYTFHLWHKKKHIKYASEVKCIFRENSLY